MIYQFYQPTEASAADLLSPPPPAATGHDDGARAASGRPNPRRDVSELGMRGARVSVGGDGRGRGVSARRRRRRRRAERLTRVAAFHDANQKFLRGVRQRQQGGADATADANGIAGDGDLAGGPAGQAVWPSDGVGVPQSEPPEAGVDGTDGTREVSANGDDGDDGDDPEAVVYGTDGTRAVPRPRALVTKFTLRHNSDRHEAEVRALESELERQSERHRGVASGLRSLLVESEAERTRLQEQLAEAVGGEARRHEAMKARWDEMIERAAEDGKWVEEQAAQWKESAERHSRRVEGARERGRLADGSDSSGGNGRGGDSGGSGDSLRRQSRRQIQRRLWGSAYDPDGPQELDSSDDSEERRIFGDVR
ncbi:hypothetical protein THAOC_26011 [Thalassiosira oceanica]|uniref:Uncharacterized protein n=1 Tax=Thalassiosira oceanica TaxID=159749 RepID=K0RML0_THAOC|nr:hypothetical protein THAOC_26011 [Thalassiosira oceanica]|eukprot:EJK54370.1 hypothetical protein THAOC_26011 [Thalassiosira oceanica]